jgi:hypothetical protein
MLEGRVCLAWMHSGLAKVVECMPGPVALLAGKKLLTGNGHAAKPLADVFCHAIGN